MGINPALDYLSMPSSLSCGTCNEDRGLSPILSPRISACRISSCASQSIPHAPCSGTLDSGGHGSCCS